MTLTTDLANTDTHGNAIRNYESIFKENTNLKIGNQIEGSMLNGGFNKTVSILEKSAAFEGMGSCRR